MGCTAGVQMLGTRTLVSGDVGTNREVSEAFPSRLVGAIRLSETSAPVRIYDVPFTLGCARAIVASVASVEDCASLPTTPKSLQLAPTS